MFIVSLARKPPSGTVIEAAGGSGTAILAIDKARIGFANPSDALHHASEWDRSYSQEANTSPIHTWDRAIGNHPGPKRSEGGGPRETGGRWPSNVILSSVEVAEALDQALGPRAEGRFPAVQRSNPGAHGKMGAGGWTGEVAPERSMGAGGVSRFYLVLARGSP